MTRTVVYFMRHGEVYNPKRVLYARLPRFGISEKGKTAVESTVKTLVGRDISIIYASPLLRAQRSAAIVSTVLHVPVRTSSLISEIRSIYAGVSLDEYYGSIQHRMYHEESIVMGHESILEVSKRMTTFFNRIIRRHEGERVLVVSHADPILILKTSMLSIPFTWEWKKVHYLHTANYLTVSCEKGICRWD